MSQIQRFELAANRHTLGSQTVIDITANGRICATIYPTVNGIKIVSQVLQDRGSPGRPRVAVDPLSDPPELHIDLTAPEHHPHAA
jgi:hypothetical protein